MSESWFSKGIEKLIWIMGMVIVAGLSSLVTLWIQDRTPEIIVRQYYNTVDTKAAIPRQVGVLQLDYKQQAVGTKSVYLLEVANEGRGPEDDLRVQALFPKAMNPKFDQIPHLRVYKPDEVTLGPEKFFMNLKGFPKNALASISFIPPKDSKLLCNMKIKAAGKIEEGKVQAIEGVECE